jgi:hypothetical protein
MNEVEKLVRTFYDSTAPGNRQRLCAIQAPDVVYDIPEGMPVGAGQFQGFQDIVDGFLAKFYGALRRALPRRRVPPAIKSSPWGASSARRGRAARPSTCRSPTS